MSLLFKYTWFFSYWALIALFFLGCKDRLFNHPLDNKSNEYVGDSVVVDLDSNGISDILEPEMVFFSDGCSWVGTNESSKELIHQVCVDSFYVQNTEVTVGFFKAIMDDFTSLENDSLPITNITWFKAVEFCNRLSELRGLQKVYQISEGIVAYEIEEADGFRLLTEAEWEIAYGADSADLYYWDSTKQATDYEWYAYPGSSGKLEKVAQKQPNPFGLYDMSGNCQEWTNDWYSQDPYPHTGPGFGTRRVIKGGSYRMELSEIRGSNRAGLSPNEANLRLGFRLGRTAY